MFEIRVKNRDRWITPKPRWITPKPYTSSILATTKKAFSEVSKITFEGVFAYRLSGFLFTSEYQGKK